MSFVVVFNQWNDKPYMRQMANKIKSVQTVQRCAKQNYAKSFKISQVCKTALHNVPTVQRKSFFEVCLPVYNR